MADLKDIIKQAKAFAKAHVRELAAEEIEWQDTAILRDGKLRELAKMLEPVDRHSPMRIAQTFAIREALEVTASPASHEQVEALRKALAVFDWLDRLSIYQDEQVKEAHDAVRAALHPQPSAQKQGESE